MIKVTPDPIDLVALVRGTAFQLMLRRAEPIEPAFLAGVSGVRPDTLAGVLDQLSEAGRIRRDEFGRVIGSAGLSVTPDRHTIQIEDREYWTWCAYDIFGIFGALAAGGRAVSSDPTDRRPIEVRFVKGRPQPTQAVLFRPDTESMASCGNVYEQWCPNSNLFATRESAETWAIANRIDGKVLTLDEAADLATDEWKAMTRVTVSFRRDAG